MKNKDKALNGALGSTEMEGIELNPTVVSILKEALSQGKKDQSFLYLLTEMMKEKEKNEHRKK